MTVVTVERMDDGVVERLRQRAAANDRSLEAELRHILNDAVTDDDYEAKRLAFIERSKELRTLTAGTRQTPSEDLIRESRDNGYERGAS